MPKREIDVGGTLVWYYFICKRQVWLISHHLTPDQDDTNIAIGRLIDETSYSREKKQLSLGSSKMDIFSVVDGKLVVGEVKKSSRYQESARMQLAFYLRELAKRGVEAIGELRFPEEKKRETITLDAALLEELENVERDILRIVYLEQPPPPVKNKWCRKCAYAEFCWS
ncbi:MAG: CRISPR-associated exonuclease Cas4 [Petrotoga sp.]|nr:CRISPR-associated exonuclease Cas4 [Petrotoga sp.]